MPRVIARVDQDCTGSTPTDSESIQRKFLSRIGNYAAAVGGAAAGRGAD